MVRKSRRSTAAAATAPSSSSPGNAKRTSDEREQHAAAAEAEVFGAPSASSATLKRFVRGLAHQIPPSRLDAMASNDDADGDGDGDDDGVLRLFLEKSTEALPMGSRVRTAAGSDFDGALELLRAAIQERIGDEIGGGDDAGSGGDDDDDDDVTMRNTSTGRGKLYPILVFSEQQYQHAMEEEEESVRKLLLCTDHATPSDILRESSPSDGAERTRQLTNALAMCGNRAETDGSDVAAILDEFLELASSPTIDPATIRQFLSCLIATEVPAYAASSAGELVGRYTSHCDVHSSANVVSTVLQSIDVDGVSEEGRIASAAHFVRGYLQVVTEKLHPERDGAAFLGAVSSLAVALRSDPLLKKRLPMFTRMGGKDNGALAQSKVLKGWADGVLANYGAGLDDTDESEGGDTSEGESEDEPPAKKRKGSDASDGEGTEDAGEAVAESPGRRSGGRRLARKRG